MSSHVDGRFAADAARLIQLQVRRPEGAFEEMTIHTTRILVGAGAHCDVRIGGPFAGREHLVIELHDGALVATALHTRPAPTLQGKPFDRVSLGQDSEVDVAGTRVRARVVAAPDRAKKARARRIAANGLLGLVLAALPGLVYAALSQTEASPIGPPPSEITSLFDRAPATCPATAADQALAAGASQLVVANVQREEHPFAVSAGISAVTKYDTAAACFAIAKRDAEARAAAEARDALRARIEADYRVHRVRVEHALDEGDDTAALREVRVIKKMTAGRKGAYADWLDMVERQLVARTPPPRV